MRSFINARFDRAAAIASAFTLEGAAQLRPRLLTASEEDFQIPHSLGVLLYALMQLKGDAILADLFQAIAEGSDLSAVAPVFNHWAISTETRNAPADFEGLNAARAACLLVNERGLARIQHLLSEKQREAFQPILSTPGARQAVSADAFKAHQMMWRVESVEIRERQSYPPAKSLATAYLFAVFEAPGGVAHCLAGRSGGDQSPGILDRMLNKAIALLINAPVISH